MQITMLAKLFMQILGRNKTLHTGIPWESNR